MPPADPPDETDVTPASAAAVTVVYTDGACRGNPGPGGWAWAVPGGAWASGYDPATTNQRMEITAAWRAVEAIEAFIHLVLDCGLRRLVLLSGRGEEEAIRAEQVLIGSGADWTVVRASWFMQNFSENFFLDDIQRGEVFFAADKITEPFVDADDIADVVARVLIEDGHSGQLYELTGPRLMTFAEAISEISRAAGRDIRYVPLDAGTFVAALKENGVPDEDVDLLQYLVSGVLDGRNESLADGVQRALGRPPRDFADYARAAAAAGAWRV